MGVVSTWLTGCGLSHAIPNFTAAGIVTPDALAELDLAHYEALGIASPDDRRKLFYLVQRIKLAVKKEGTPTKQEKAEPQSIGDQVDAAILSTVTTSFTEEEEEEEVEVDDDSAKEQDPAANQSHGESSGQHKNSMTTPTKPKPIKSSSNATNPSKSSPSKIQAPMTKRSPSRLTPPKSSVAASSAKVNNNNESDKDRAVKMATSPGETTTPNKSPRNKGAVATTVINASLDIDVSTNVADVEGSNDIRRSKHIDKKDPNTTRTVTSRPTAKSQPSTALVKTIKPTATANVTATPKMSETAKSQLAQKKTLTAPSRRLSSGLITPQPKSKPGLQAQQQNRNNTASKSSSSSLPQPSRLSSKLQNPSKSIRTGKQLSTIHSDEILPMSPMIPPKLISAAQKKPNLVQPTKISMPRRSLGGGGRGSDSDHESDTESSVGGGSSRSRSQRRGRRTTLDPNASSMSDSDSSVNSSKRRRSLGVTALKAKPKLPKGRVSDVVSNSRGKISNTTTNTIMSRSNIGARKTGPKSTVKGGMTIRSGSEPDSSFQEQIVAMRNEVDQEHELFSDHMFEGDDDDDDDDHMIRVIVRKRPFNKHKTSDIDAIHPLEYGYYGKMLVYQPVTRVDLTKEIHRIPFCFDSVFDSAYDNSQIYDKSVRNMIPVVVDGQHATVFAFGATGSGKTHTMMGSNFTGKKVQEESNMGLYYMAALDVFHCLDDPEYHHLSVGVSLFEIYGGKLFDLLNNRRAVKCLEDHQGKVQFPGLSEHNINSPPELIDLIELGAQNRSTGTTSRNADSSRSHAVLQLHLRKAVGREANVEHGRLTFIDLAGSERGADTANFSRATRLEGAEINTSLLALKEVIRARAKGGSMVHVPFRGSKLTQVLKESFVGENSRCLMIACIAPDMDNCEQTLNTLRYADRVKERNPETGALPAKFVKRGGRRRVKSTASIPSIVSSSDQSMHRNRKIGMATMKPENDDAFVDDSFSDSRSSMKESEPETFRNKSVNRLRPAITTHKSHRTTGDEDEDLLDAVLSEDNDHAEDAMAQTQTLEEDLVALHGVFLKDITLLLNVEMDAFGKLMGNRDHVSKYSSELEVVLQDQERLVSDIAHCFRSAGSPSLGAELQFLNSLLAGLLEIVHEEQSVAQDLECESNMEAMESLQELKFTSLGDMETCFKGKPQTKKGAADGNLSDDSFEDLRV